MAIKLEDKVNVDAPSGTYPYGKIRDNSGANDGTPVDTNTYGDFHQFFARIMDITSTAYNGLLENATNGFQYVEALIALIRSTTATLSLFGTTKLADTSDVDVNTLGALSVTPNALNNTYRVVHNVTSTVILSTKVIEIGDWDMFANDTKSVTHGLANYKKIRSIEVVIRNDADNSYRPLNSHNGLTGAVNGGVATIDTTDINLSINTTGDFDSTDYDSTSYNRGWITILYQTN